MSALSLAEAALELVGSDPRAALARADEAGVLARSEDSAAAGAVSQRAAGLALRELGDLVTAEARSADAVRIAEEDATLPRIEAEARMSLAFVLLERGKVRRALGEADRAAGALRGLPAARLASQRALILQRTGQLEEALAAYVAALPVLRRGGDLLWEARALNNRGLLHAFQNSLGPAEADLRRSRDLHLRLGNPILASDADWNLGFVAARAGDVPAALARYAEVERVREAQGTPDPRLLLDRCEVLLDVGLTDEAVRTAERAVEAMSASGQGADLAEGRLLLAGAALAAGRPAVASAGARAARQAFVRQGRSGWAMLARFVGLRAAEMGGGSDRRLVRLAAESAVELAAGGWRIEELDARLVAARAAFRLGDVDVARAQLVAAAAARRTGSLGLRARAWYAEALLRRAGGSSRAVSSALRAGLSLVERAQASLGATELRAHVAGHGADLAALGLELAAERGDPRAVLAWAERWRAGSLRFHPARPPEDPELAAALADVRMASADVAEARLSETGSVAGATARLRTAEIRVVNASRTARSPLHGPTAPPPGPGELTEELGDGVLVEYVHHEGSLLAVTVRRDRCRLHRLGPIGPVTDAIESAHFTLNRLASGFGTPRSLATARTAAAAALSTLDELLIWPLRAEVDDRPLVVVPTGALHPAPWGGLPSLAGRPVRIAPSAGSWLRAARTAPANGGRTVFAAGPGLPAAEEEVRGLGADYPGADLLVSDAASASAVLAALNGADLAHVAAHGRLRTDNPLFSALELADGPLTVYDVEGLTAAPRTVLLPACQSGMSGVRAGDELMGLVAALLAVGTRTVVAAVVPVRDDATAPLMRAVHAHLRAGSSPAEALAAARTAVDQDDAGAYAAAAAFGCFGG